MKIALAVNTFDTDLNRFKLANQSYEMLSKQDNVDVFDIQLPSKKGKFKTVDSLKRVSSDVIPGSTKDLPFVNDLFGIAADLDYDYFIVTNADVMISPRLIDHIIDNDITALPCSRLDVEPVADISQGMKPVRWEIAGFDTFCFKTDWYKEHSGLFKDYLMGKPYYDHHYATLMKVFGNNDILGNKNPAFCLHEHHGTAAVTTQDVEQNFNKVQYNNSILAQKYRFIWDEFFEEHLLKRKPWGRFQREVEGETELELKHFEKGIVSVRDEITLDINQHCKNKTAPVMNKRLTSDGGLEERQDVKDTFVVICNGPSLRGFDFNKIKGYESIGMNAAYRMFEKIDFWPTYFSCGDLVVGMSHKDEYKRLLEERDSVFFLRQNVANAIKSSGNVSEVDLKKLYEINCIPGKVGEFNVNACKLNIMEPGCTGQLSAMIGVALGFKKIVLLGADCNYDESCKGLERSKNEPGLVVSDEEYSSPDHWFDDYLQKGDKCNVPGAMTYHMGGWRVLSDVAKANDVEVINCSMVSKIPFFKKCNFDEVV